MTNEEYGQRLRDLRGELGLSLREVEERGGPSKDVLSPIERGLHKPRTQTLGKVAQAFGMSVAELRARLEEGSPKELRNVEELLDREGISTRWLLLPEEEFEKWWLDITREEAIRHYWEIHAEWEAIIAEQQAAKRGTSAATPELQEWLDKNWIRIWWRKFGATGAAPGARESVEEFYERQRLAEQRRLGEEAIDRDPRELVAGVTA